MRSDKTLRLLIFCAAAFPFIAAPIYMEQSHQVFINGNLLGNALTVNGGLAVPVEDLARTFGPASVRVQGNQLKLLPAVQQSPRDPQSGLPTGKRMHKPFVVTKELSSATPVIISGGKQYISLPVLARIFGGTYTGPTTLRNGEAIRLNFAPNPNAAVNAQ